MSYTDELLILSESTNGRGIAINVTTSPGALIHTASSTAGVIDYPELLVANNHTALVMLYLLWGGTSASDLITVPIEFQDGLKRVTLPQPVFNGVAIRAYASVANVLNVFTGPGSTRLTEVA
ncbi:hypothetical protein [Pantanalinema sp. GBBB05]|uniref:hypothetical protein n=1 Tax=Pantanalinema sp. GBBB05 TaxID=2604139 RepID=UPI001D6E6B65|nr:hypothetical protein [Pantanalinema sp. GBBB05]